jgi:UDP-N-acetylglucosamine:LPS N-acetylglucosamine transferase
MKKRILYLYSETGGGHRAAATALMAAVDQAGNKKYFQKMVDVFASSSNFLNVFAKMYGPVIKYSPKIWGMLYYWLNSPSKLKNLEIIAEPFIMKNLSQLIKKVKPHIIVSIHPMVNHLTVRAIEKVGKKIPFIIVVMDPVTLHRAWITPGADRIIVATPEARKCAIKYGMSAKKVKVIGLPIHPMFSKKSKVKKNRGKKLFTILLMGGGEGTGKMDKIVYQFEKQKIKAKVIVICGKNHKLQNKLENLANQLSFPLEVHGFTDKVPEIMTEADLIVTKAGPGSIAEAMAMDLPIIINSWLPGQEEGNVEFVVRENVGKVSKDPKKTVKIIKNIMKPANYKKIMKNIKRVRRPKAALDIAKELFKWM